MKILYKNILYQLICIYPVLNIAVCFLFNGKNMNLFSSSYVFLLVLLILLLRGKISLAVLTSVFIIMPTVFLAFIRESEFVNVTSVIMFGITVMSFIFFSAYYFDIIDFGKYLVRKKQLFYCMQSGFLMILFLHYILNGLRHGWSTLVLQGPYNYPHTLAYLLFFIAMANIYLFFVDRSKIGSLFTIIHAVLISLTAVRVVLLVVSFVAIILLIRFISAKQLKKVVVTLIVIILFLFWANKYGVFKALIDKTLLAIKNSTITNGRGVIAINSLRALDSGGLKVVINILFGIGMEDLLLSNYNSMNAPIHAHNDFVNVLVCYGIVNFILYVTNFYKFSHKSIVGLFFSVGLLAFGNGLFMYVDIIPIIVFSRLLFEMPKYKSTNLSRQYYLKKGLEGREYETNHVSV